jgi:hypothetical protein
MVVTKELVLDTTKRTKALVFCIVAVEVTVAAIVIARVNSLAIVLVVDTDAVSTLLKKNP